MSYRRVHYAWIMVGVVFLALVAAGGIRSIPGILIIPLEEEFGWTRATVSLALSINLLFFGLCGPFAAAISEKVGIRRTMVAAFLTLGVAIGLTTLMRDAWQFQLLWGLLVGLGTGAIGTWVAVVVANRWFAARRGLVSGILLTGGTTGQIVFLPLLASVVVGSGWRLAVLIVAGFTLLVVPIAAKYVHSHPQDIGLQPHGAPAGDASLASAPVTPPKLAGNPFLDAIDTLQRGLTDRNFLLLSGTFFACGASANGLIGTHLIPASVEHGIPEVVAAGFFSLMGVLNIFGTTAAGWLSDRFDCRRLLAAYYGLRGLALLFLPSSFAAGYPGMTAFVAFYGLEWAATAVPTMRLTADIFGNAKVGTVFAWILVSHQLGAATMSLAAGALRTWQGDYHAAFIAAGIICLIAAAMALLIGRPVSASPPAIPIAEREQTVGVAVPAAGR